MQDARMLLRPSLLPRKPCKMCLTVWFLRRFGLKTGIDFAHFGLDLEHGFRSLYERILRFNSKRVICEFETVFFFWRSNLINK